MIYLKYSHRAASLLVFLPMVSMGQRAQENVVPLKNWATPLYWQPNQAERETAGQAAPQLQFSANAVSTNALTFIAITPCRLVDTRGAAAGFNGEAPFDGPSIASKATLTIPVQSPTEATTNTTPAPCGVIPSIAQAYSFNLTVVPVAAGAVDYVTMWPAGSTQPVVATLDDPQGAIVSNAAIVPAGPSASPGYGGVSVYNDGPASANVIIDMNGYYAAPTDVSNNTAIGLGTLASNTTGIDNTATGSNALQDNTTGSWNTAAGKGALQVNTTGYNNTANGQEALGDNTSGNNNTATGTSALLSNTTGSNNTASGQAALQSNTTGINNTASGQNALNANTTGNQNTAVGTSALLSNTTGNNNTASGQAALQFNTIGNQNTGVGTAALAGNTTGNYNTAVGAPSLPVNTTGSQNTAIGTGSLGANTTGGSNTASGQAALFNNTTGANNTANGVSAMFMNTTGNGNTGIGYGVMQNNTGGYQNTAIGIGALSGNTAGNVNIAVGVSAGNNLTTGSDNIDIGNPGVAGEGDVIRIGTAGTQTSTYIAGIYGATPSTPNSPVCIDSNGKLGTSGCTVVVASLSSRRFKDQIADMGDASSKLLQLRPVTFFYKPQYDDGSHALQYGLIAEEVAKIYPDMVGYDKDGQPNSVKYQALAPMLVNELQKQTETIRLQNERIEQQEARLAALEALLSGTKPSSADSDH